MADIMLAQCGDGGWLIRGEQHIDDLLANTLQPDISIEVVPCQSKSEVDALWFAEGGQDVTDMWMIHPAILRRTMGMTGRLSLVFAEWSASLDDAAQAALASAADALARSPGGRLVLIKHIAEDAPAMAAEMANLRLSLVEARLAALGIAPASLVREAAPAERPEQADHIDLIVRVA